MARVFVYALAICLSATACTSTSIIPTEIYKADVKAFEALEETTDLVEIVETLPESPQKIEVKKSLSAHVETVKELIVTIDDAKKETALIVTEAVKVKNENVVLKENVKRLTLFKVSSLVILAVVFLLFLLRLRLGNSSS